MKRFRQYILQEKISQKEIKSALSDPNITFGMEFEYVDDNLSNGEFEKDASYLQELYGDLERDVEELKKSYEQDRDEYQDEIRQEIQTLIDDKQESINDLEDANSDLDEEEDTDEIEENENAIREFQDEIDKLENIEGYEREEWAENELNWYYDYFERNPYNTISIPDELLEFWRIYDSVDEEQILRGIYMDVFYEEDAWNSDLVYPDLSYGNDYPDGSDWVEYVEQNFNFDDLPFDNYEVAEYHGGSSSSSNWRIEEDSSLSEGGVEIISPALPITQAKEVIKDMFDYISDNGETDSSTGLHVHLGYKGVNMSQNLDLLKMMMFTEENWVLKNFPEREGNSYTLSMIKKLDKTFKEHPDYPSALFKSGKDDIQWIFKDFQANVLPQSTKYNSINWEPIGKGHIEIRWMGGTNYHKKYKEVITALGRFASYLKLALDPEYKKEEYLKKLYRLAVKADYLRSDKEIKETQKQINVVERDGLLLGSASNKYGSIRYYYSYKNDVYMIYTPEHNGTIKEFEKIGKTKNFYKTSKKIKDFKIDTDNWLKTYKRV